MHLRLTHLLLGLAAVAIIATAITYSVDRLGSEPSANANTAVYCAADVTLCPDGVTSVGRVPPDCAFAACLADDVSPVSGNTNQSNSNTATEAKTTSYGLWFPFSGGLTVNNPRPVIYGKVSQRNQTYVTTTFGIEEWVGRSFGGAKSLKYLAGTVTGLTIQLDGDTIEGVQGFPQFPMIACQEYKRSGDGFVPVIYDTESECRKVFADRLPPLIFVFRPSSDLSVGTHTLTVNGTSMAFSYDPTSTVGVQSLTAVGSGQSPSRYFDHTDGCAPGYYQTANDFPLPLPKQQNNRVMYGLSFPQSDEEKGSIRRRHVELSLGGQQFPIFFPDSPTYYEGQLVGNGPGRTDFGLFVPLNNLVFADGKAAKPWVLYEADPGYEDLVTGYYTELFPVDISGREYRGRSIPWETSTSSGCDG